MKNLFLISSSKYQGGQFWAHCDNALGNFLGHPQKGKNKIIFIPHANADMIYDQYTLMASGVLSSFGYEVVGLHKYSATEMHDMLKDPAISTMCIGGGNTWLLNYILQEKTPPGFLRAIKEKIDNGEWKYIGASAGTVTACPTFLTTNDMPVVLPKSEKALNIVPFQINPHFVPGALVDKHMGETREERIRQVILHNPDWQVVGLPEGCWIEGRGNEYVLYGTGEAAIFRKDGNNSIWLPGESFNLVGML